MAVRAEPAAPDDAPLAQRARRGDLAAMEELLDRHLASTWQLANVVHGPGHGAVATTRSVAAVLSSPVEPTVHPRSVRLQLLTSARAEATAEAVAATAPPASTPSGLLDDDATARVRAAFAALPEGWRSVLWLRLVEDLGARDTAAVLGLDVASTQQLLERARAGWQEGAISQRVAGAAAIECRRATLLLRGYVEGGLSERDRTRVRRHLDACDSCRSGLEELDDLGPLLRRSAPGLPADLRSATMAAWLEAVASRRGPFGLLLPGGRPVPPWAERALAGATAAVVALGITAAVLGGGRDPRTGRDLVIVQPAEPPRSSDGESALADPTATPGSELTDPDVGVGPSIGSSMSPSEAGPTSSSAPLPREVPRSAPGPTGPGPAGPPTTAPPPPGPGPTPPPSGAEPGVTVRVDGDTGVTIGPDCTGVEVVGVVIGCEPGGQSSLPLPGV